ncbi:FG-GAP-like repeat-containing protein [Gimesia aquarii]|uniref:Tetratricopeptide repeat protein n=1 Tax=Gimesia aquarii TaxID=2527964 RepID=A0A517VWI6_9PLAN|nr:FG-GAP-like repeat-containing protein [Gimesia aquarii]QDT97367.1 tetratricopeptide repeat protein [Gimesia aquarii]
MKYSSFSDKRLLLLPVAALAFFIAWWKAGSENVNVEQQFREVQIAIERNDIEEALDLLDNILERSPNHSQALLYRGQLRRDAGNLAGASSDWKSVPDHPPMTGGVARYLEATILLEKGKARLAEQKLLRAVELHPSYPQPNRRLLELYIVQGRRDDVHQQLTRIAQSRALAIDELVFRFVAPERATVPAAGSELMRSYIAADPEDQDSKLALVRYLLEEEKYSEADDILQPLIVADPQDERAVGLLVEILLKQGKTQHAGEILSKYYRRKPSPEFSKSVGYNAAEVEDWATAAKHYLYVAQERPEDTGSLYRLGQVLQRLECDVEAQQCLRQAKLMDRLQRQALRLVWGSRDKVDLMVPIALEVGDLLAQLGRRTEALLWYEQILAVRPGYEPALAGLRKITENPEHPETQPYRSERLLSKISKLELTNFLSDEASLTVSPLTDRSTSIRLSDVHAEAGVDYQFIGRSKFKYPPESTSGGVGVLDYDQDGWPDLYFPQGCRLPYNPDDFTYLDRLYRNRGDGTFEDVTERVGLRENRYGQGITAGDYNSDGFPDLVVVNFGRNTFLLNNGDGSFTDITNQVGLTDEVMSSSAAFADLDRDGLLDLYVVNYLDSIKICHSPDGTYSSCNPSNFEGEQDRLYHNRGDGTFEDITSESGIVVPDGKGLGIIIADLNEDGLPDVYVANDTTPNFLFRNLGAEDGIRFVEEGLLSGVALSGDGRSEAGMGVACADLDGNGALDLYVTNFYQETNTLYLNQGSGDFLDSTRLAGLAKPTHSQLGFGTQAVDLNLDGLPELFVANGHIDDFGFRGEPWKMHPQLFENVGEGKFTDVSSQSGNYFQQKYLGRGVARLDWNRDGRPDLFVVHQDSPVALLKNETSNVGNGVVIELHGVKSNRDAVGARLRVTADGLTQVLEVCGGDGFFCVNERRQFVGVGNASHIDELEIIWPNGNRETHTQLPTHAKLVFIEGKSPLVMRDQ